MKRLHTILTQWLLGLAAVFSVLQPALAQDKYPSRPIEFIVPWGPGGGADQLARKIAPALEKELKVSLPVINVAGATGQTGLNKMLTSAADGYSISIFIADTLAVLMDPATKWKLEDIVPTAVMIRQPSAFFVAESSPLKTWADVEREAKKRPLKVAITGFGSADDLLANSKAALDSSASAGLKSLINVIADVRSKQGGAGIILRADSNANRVRI